MSLSRNQMLMIAVVLVIFYYLNKDTFMKKDKYAAGGCPYCKG